MLATDAQHREAAPTGRVDSDATVQQHGTDWIDTFERQHGRRPRILHVGNIANNAYNNAKLQRSAGIEADVLCYDYYHIMGCPEWEDADFDAAGLDHFQPRWDEIDLNGFQRPAWFVQGDLASCVKELLGRFENENRRERSNLVVRLATCGLGVLRRLTRRTRQLAAVVRPATFLRVFRDCSTVQTRSRVPRRLRRIIACALLSADSLYWSIGTGMLRCVRAAWRNKMLWKSWSIVSGTDYDFTTFLDRCTRIRQLWDEQFPDREPMTEDSLIPYYSYWRLFRRLFPHYDVIQAYSTDPMWPLLCDARPYIAYEHGTIRDFPYRQDVIGQLTSLSYRNSSHTFVTNGDCLEHALRLKIPSFSPMLHGIDDKHYSAAPQLRTDLQQQYGVSRLYLCPLRHDWEVKGTDQHIRALPFLVAESGRDFRVFMTTWGNDIDQSRKLAEQLGVDDLIVWLSPLPRQELIRWTGAMDCVLDQVRLPHFGATAPESLGCGTPVIMSYNPDSTRWIIEEAAPILSAWTPEEIARHLVALLDDDYQCSVSAAATAWFRGNHTSLRILSDHIAAYARVLDKPSLPTIERS